MRNTKKIRKNKINKRKIFILICLIMLCIFEIIAFKESRAERIIDITASIIDSENLLEDEEIVVTATDTGNSGCYIVLPETIGNKKVGLYIVEEKNLHEDNIEETTESNQNENIENTQITNEQGILNNPNENVIDINDNTILQNNVTNITNSELANNTENIITNTQNINSIEVEQEVDESNNISNIEVNQESSNSQDANNEVEEETNIVEKVAGERIYLTDDEIKEKKVTLKVVYDTLKKDSQTLYKQNVEAQIDENNDEVIDKTIKVEGYMPLGTEVKATVVSRNEVEQNIKDMLTEKVSLKIAYDIKLIYEDKEFEPTDFDTNVKVSILGIDKIDEQTQKYKVVHIKDENVVEEIKNVKSNNDEVTFKAGSFSTYAVLLEDNVQTAALYSLDIDGASIWDGTTASEFRFGSGTESDPYLITNGKELSYLAQNVNNGNTYEGKYFQLIADIDLNGNEWTPIGSYDYSFRGVFDGLGHTIANASIELPTTMPNSIQSYGFFGSLGGGSSGYAVVKNVQFESITVNINYSGQFTNGTRGYNIGIVSGSLFRNSEIRNVIVNGSSITDGGNTIQLRNNANQLFVGGIAGYAVYSSSNTSDPKDGNRYKIENCYSDVDVDLNTYPRNYSASYSAQYAVGGIIGGIKSQPVWPKNCLYTGSINADYAFVGPIFGYLRNNTAYTSTNNYATLWNGYDAGNTSMTAESYFTSYTVNGSTFSTSVSRGNSSQRISSGSWWGGFEMGQVQGVNKGLYTNNLNTMLSNFNTYVNNNSQGNYVKWYLDSSSNNYYFIPPFSAEVNKNSPEYTINVIDEESSGTYTYQWYINDNLDSSITGNTAIINSSWTESYTVEVLISNGTSYTMISFEVPLLEIHISFEMNNNTNTLTAGLEGTGTSDPNFNLSDYTYKWYKADIAETEEEIEGATTNTITDLENGIDYKVVATNNRYPYMSAEGTYIYGNRTVIYVDETNGRDYNDGFTPQTAVQSLDTAYGKFDSTTTRDENIIVLMNDYTDTGFLDSETSTTFRKNVTITGKYKGTDYAPSLQFEAYNNGYKYLNGNTTFMYLTFDGSYGRRTSQTYFYLQGYSLTMGEGIKVTGYATANPNQGLIKGSSPAFHIFAGWLQYDYTSLPRTGAKILIKSGTYGRILLGGSSGNSDTSSITKYNSHNFMGTSLTDDLYIAEITIDIQNSTTPTNYTYDINLLGGGSTCGNIYGDIKINIKNGSIGRLLGASIGDSSYRPNNWNYPLNTFIGTATINMTGGSVTEMYGGCLGRNMTAIRGNDTNPIACDSYFYGTVNINISGGIVSETIYGAGAGGVSGYSENSTDVYKSYGQNIDTVVNINISGGTIDADIYGGGYGYTNYLTANSTQVDGGTLYGNSNINISGSPKINGSIYGGGRGYDLATNKPDLAQMEGKSTITISGTPTITGNIYGAGMGISQYSEMAKFTGTTTININSDLSTNVFGGGSISLTSGNTNIYINEGTHTADIYGGGNVGEVDGNSYVYITGGTSSDVYGGGNQAGVNNTNITITGGTTQNIYGGSNQSGEIDSTTIDAKGGTITNIYGGNNAGGTCPITFVTVDGSKIIEAVYGGGNQVATTTTNVYLLSSDGAITSAFGGGKSADATNTNVYCQGATAIDVFGGSNTSGAVETSKVEITSGSYTNIYGGNNLGGSNEESFIKINGGTTENIYGGGNQVEITTSNIEMNSGTVTNVYGGGNQAGATTTNVNINGGNLSNAYGGANKSGTVTDTNVTLQSSSTSANRSGVNMEVTYTAKEATWETTEYPTVVDVTIEYTNNTDTTIDTWESYIQSEGAVLFTNYSSSEIIENNGKFSLNQDDRYYGTHSLTANGTYSISFQIFSPSEPEKFALEYQFLGNGADGNKYEDTNTGLRIFGGNNAGGITINSHVTIQSGTAFEVYGGNNKDGNTLTSNVIITGGTVKTVYGGNNLGGTTTTSNITHSGGTIDDVYGGGNQAVTDVTYVTINARVNNCVYGGGNAAGVNTNTNLEIISAEIGGNVYGGGNEGKVTANTYVHIKDAALLDSVYAGGNGTTAIVMGNTNLTMEGTTTTVTNSVFGGGNQASTGTEATNNSKSTVNIVGGTIGKNVYGGANTSVVYGYTYTNIGYDAVNDNTLTIGDITIGGTIFGGGEANASGSEIYDYDFISVTKGIEMNINGTGHDKCVFKGSIFGSGNASSTSGYSYINIKNYGSVYDPQSNVSIQRANVVTLDNSSMMLSGAKDRTNEYSNEFFTLSRIDELKLKNGSILYLNYGANLLKKLTSCVDENGTEVKATVTIDESGNTNKNVDNRIYMLEGKNLNIATNENVTAYGQVSGMTFFGLFTNAMNPSTSTGIYNIEYENGDEIVNAGTFSSNSYVKGAHLTDHDTTIDGFYSNYEEEENPGVIKTKYIETTPEDDIYYIWLVGIELDVTTFEITLTGSKYATLGTYEQSLSGFSVPNTKFALVGFSAGLESGISLIEPTKIENIALEEETANTVFGLSMKTGNNGWMTNSQTNFLTENGGTYTGESTYNSDNSTYTPSLNFCFYHSGNISIAQTLGNVKIRFQALIPIDDLNDQIEYIDINITLVTALYQNDFYEAARAPGEEFSLFTTTETNITDSSRFSTYYSLYIPEFSESDYYEDYRDYQHVLVSRKSTGEGYAFTQNTKITMIDMVTNKYYYYVVTENDESQGKYVYNLSDFVAMGSDIDSYDENSAWDDYYLTEQDILYENYIFHIDFGENIIEDDLIDNTLLMELRDQENQTLIGVLGIQRDSMIYSVYKNRDATINVSAQTSEDVVYLGNSFTLTVTTDFRQDVVNSKTIFDTSYFDEKMGIKISIYDSYGNRLNSDSLLGVSFELDNIKYYPRIDGTVRINVAEKVSNVLSKIKIDTANNTVLATGEYTIKVESFGSPDGIYYGIESSDEAEVTITIIESSYGLKVYTNDQSKIIEKDTGKTQAGNNLLKTTIEYTSKFNNPSIAVSLYRRKYTNEYEQSYELVDLNDYLSIALTQTQRTYEYEISNNPTATMEYFMYLNTNLKTGTYKLVFKLYDNDSYIGEAYEYLIIK